MDESRSEFAFIDWVRRQCPNGPAVSVGIGNDAAVLQPTRESFVTVDMLMEGVDFRWPETPARLIGRKALAVNLSDIAAMGGRPIAAFIATALPRSRGRAFAEELHTGIIELANEYQVTIAGGDTNSWDGPLVISITVWGEPCGPQPILRSGARPGDWLFVTGACGGSIHGRHLTFPPRLAEAARLVELGPPSAMIDISDGLAADLHHVLTASGVGASVWSKRVPIHPDAIGMDGPKSPLQRALSDGEDFELLVTASPELARQIIERWNLPTPLTHIGEITAERECILIDADGTSRALPALGWTHAVQ